MKIVLLISLLACSTFGQGLAWLATATKPAAAGGGPPVKKQEQTTDADFTLWGTVAIQKYSSSWIASSSYTLTSVKVKLAPQEGGESNRVVIYATKEYEEPIGSALATSQWVNTSDYDAYPGGLKEFTFGTPLALTSGHTNCIVLEHSQPDGNHRVYTKISTGGARYTYKYDGASWGANANAQFVFELWGY